MVWLRVCVEVWVSGRGNVAAEVSIEYGETPSKLILLPLKMFSNNNIMY